MRNDEGLMHGFEKSRAITWLFTLVQKGRARFAFAFPDISNIEISKLDISHRFCSSLLSVSTTGRNFGFTWV